MMSKMCLGTVQFGLDYGIANKAGKVPKEEVSTILKYAQEIGLKALDTSIAYGESEEIIGEFISEYKGSFEIVSKILVENDHFEPEGIKQSLSHSLQRLNTEQLYGCLVHQFEDFIKFNQLWNVLEEAKKDGLAKKIGFSLYHPNDLELILDRRVCFDIVQVPYSIFDRRFERYFKVLKERNVEIHTRSVFLQGLAFLKPDELSEQLSNASKQLNQLRKVSDDHSLSVSAVCLKFVLSNQYVDKVVIGVDGLEQFKNNVHEFKEFNKDVELKEELENLIISDEDILLPFKWDTTTTNV